MEKKSAMDVFMAQQAMPEEAERETQELISDEAIEKLVGASDAKMARSPGFAPQQAARRKPAAPPIPPTAIKTSEQLQMEKEPIAVRETGALFWRRVVVPPNVYVIHTRMGKKEPVTIGLGLSFAYDRARDAYQVIPASIQTIGVVANCISREKQGINVLAYVQWQVEDISVAYRKIDFSDRRDPLAIVNAQLREQAEAAIKDKIATMSVEDVLADKAPIIAELTTRLRAVTEEQDSDGKDRYEGLGIRIITVQIREALVCSQTLWTDLQSPFRYEQAKRARISYLESQDEINRKELETRRQVEIREAETNVEIERIKQKKETEGQELRLREEAERYERAQDAERRKIAELERTKVAETESRERLAAKDEELRLARELDIARNQGKKEAEEASLRLEAERREITMAADRDAHRAAEESRLLAARTELEKRDAEAVNAARLRVVELTETLKAAEDRAETKALEETLLRDRMRETFQAEMAEMRNAAANAQEEAALGLERIRNEIRNLVGEGLLASELISRLPEIAEAMPKPDSLTVLQSGNAKGDAAESVVSFVSRLVASADALGISIPGLARRANAEGGA